MKFPDDRFTDLKLVTEVPTAIPDDVPLDEIADRVVRGKLKLSPPQMRLLIELLPYYRPKLTAVAVGVMNGDSFAAQLDRAIKRQERAKAPPKMIDVTPQSPMN